MRRFVLTLASVICCLIAAGCDKCGAGTTILFQQSFEKIDFAFFYCP